jgi:hypothetical protein
MAAEAEEHRAMALRMVLKEGMVIDISHVR